MPTQIEEVKDVLKSQIQTLNEIQSELAEFCLNLRTQINYWEEDCSCSIQNEYYTFFYERWDKGSYLYGDEKQPKENETKEQNQLCLFEVEKPSNEYDIKESWDYYAVELNDTWQLPLKTRLLLHQEVLKLCKEGETLETSAKTVIEDYKASIIKYKE